MKTFKIGQTITINNITYKCCKSMCGKECENCDIEIDATNDKIDVIDKYNICKRCEKVNGINLKQVIYENNQF